MEVHRILGFTLSSAVSLQFKVFCWCCEWLGTGAPHHFLSESWPSPRERCRVAGVCLEINNREQDARERTALSFLGYISVARQEVRGPLLIGSGEKERVSQVGSGQRNWSSEGLCLSPCKRSGWRQWPVMRTTWCSGRLRVSLQRQ